MPDAHILEVEDSPSNLALVSHLLGVYGYVVPKAFDSEGAPSAIRQKTPDLILMDIRMPGTEGLALTRKLKGDESTKRIRIVAFAHSFQLLPIHLQGIGAGHKSTPFVMMFKNRAGEARHSWTLEEINMNNVIKHSERPRKNILWQAISQPAQCAPQYEAIPQGAGVLKRCFQCGSLEAE